MLFNSPIFFIFLPIILFIYTNLKKNFSKSPKSKMVYVTSQILDWYRIDNAILEEFVKIGHFIYNNLKNSTFKVISYDIWEKNMADLTHVNEVGASIIISDIQKILNEKL